MINSISLRLRQGAITVLITSVLFGGIEIGLRLFVDASWIGGVYMFHPTYLIQPRPNAQSSFQRTVTNGGPTIASRTNKWGFRGKDFERETDEIRVMVYGDSNIEARFSTYENTFAGRLEAELEARTGHSYQVINAGVAGFGPDQTLLKVADEIPVWNPDLVIVHIFADNDYGDILRNRLLYIDDETGKIVNRGIPLIEKFISYTRELYALKAIKKIIYATLSKTGKAIGVTLQKPNRRRPAGEPALDRHSRRIGEEYKAYFNRSLPRSIGDHYDLDIALDPDSDSGRIKIKLMKETLGRIFLFVKIENNVPIIFLIQPSTKDISTNSKLNYQKLETISEKYRRDNLVKPIESVLDRLNADYVNLFDSFVTSGRTPYYFAVGDNHWNDAGQALAAKLMAERLVGNYGTAPVQKEENGPS